MNTNENIIHHLRHKYNRVVMFKTNTMTIFSIDDKFDLSYQGNRITLYYKTRQWVVYSLIGATMLIDKLVIEDE